MSGLLGRADGLHRGWPTKWPVSSLGALVIAVVVGIGIFTIQNGVMWTPLQRWYWGQYLNTEIFPTRASSPQGNYRLLAKVDRHGQQRMAVDSDVVPTRQLGRQLIPFALSPQAHLAEHVWVPLGTCHQAKTAQNESPAEGRTFPLVTNLAGTVMDTVSGGGQWRKLGSSV